MTKESFFLLDGFNDQLSIRTINTSDLTYLRLLKNSHREFFFHKCLISSSQQLAWFKAYQGRPRDYIFILIYKSRRVGCMGVRLVDNCWDVYNVMLGDKRYQGSGIMSRGLAWMITFANTVSPREVWLSVLRSNPAVSWYQRNGFKVEGVFPTYLMMRFEDIYTRGSR